MPLQVVQLVELVEEDEEFDHELGQQVEFSEHTECLQRRETSLGLQRCTVDALDEDHRQNVDEKVHGHSTADFQGKVLEAEQAVRSDEVGDWEDRIE